jgi:ankyrin repeat protein
MVKRGTHDDWKPIMDAAFVGDAARVKKLLDAGVDPNIVSRTVHRYRPLHRAIETKKTTPRNERHEAVVKLLLERGADPKLRGTMEKLTALQLAA